MFPLQSKYRLVSLKGFHVDVLSKLGSKRLYHVGEELFEFFLHEPLFRSHTVTCYAVYVRPRAHLLQNEGSEVAFDMLIPTQVAGPSGESLEFTTVEHSILYTANGTGAPVAFLGPVYH